MKKLFGIFLTVAAISCCQSDDSEIQAVKIVVNGILEADNRADINSVVSFYDEEAILMPSGKPEIKGHAAIRTNYRNIFNNSSVRLTAEIETVEVSGNLAYCKGRTKGQVITKADSSKIEVDDKFLMILSRKSNAWKITCLMWSKDQ